MRAEARLAIAAARTGRAERAGTVAELTGVAESVAVPVGLIGVQHVRAVVDGVGDLIGVGIGQLAWLQRERHGGLLLGRDVDGDHTLRDRAAALQAVRLEANLGRRIAEVNDDRPQQRGRRRDQRLEERNAQRDARAGLAEILVGTEAVDHPVGLAKADHHRLPGRVPRTGTRQTTYVQYCSPSLPPLWRLRTASP